MKLLSAGLFILWTLYTNYSLAQKVAADAKEGEVIVKGKIANINYPAQIWIYMGDEKWDTATLRNGEFEYKKKTMLPAYGAMMLRYKPYISGDKSSGSFFSNMSLLSLFFEKGTMTVNTKVDTLNSKYATVKGSGIHEKHRVFWKKEGDIIKGQKKLAADFNKATPEQLQSAAFIADYEKKNEELLKEWDILIENEIKNHPSSLHAYMDYLGYRRQREPDEATSLAIAEHFSPMYKEKAVDAVTSAERQKRRAEVNIEEGAAFPLFDLKSPSGAKTSLNDYRGKYVLVDFWASWCGPCRKVNPDLVNLYNKYKESSFEIIGVSLDTDAKAWQEAITADKLPWIHASDLKGMDGQAADKYGIMYIPQSYLLDPQGKVVAKNLKPEELDETLQNLLK